MGFINDLKTVLRDNWKAGKIARKRGLNRADALEYIQKTTSERRKTMAVDAEGTKIQVGDSVGFKSDHEQVGEVVDINGDTLTLYNKDGFSGAYLRYAERAYEEARRCYVV